jgi:hypothetical protein
MASSLSAAEPPSTPAPVGTSMKSVSDPVPLAPAVLSYATPIYEMVPMNSIWLDFLVTRQTNPVRSRSRFLNTSNYAEKFLVLEPAEISIFMPRHLEGSSDSDMIYNLYVSSATISSKSGLPGKKSSRGVLKQTHPHDGIKFPRRGR